MRVLKQKGNKMDKPITGIVKQLESGVVVECSLSDICEKNQAEPPCVVTPHGTRRKACMLSINDHGERCSAHKVDSSVWLIHENPAYIAQLRR